MGIFARKWWLYFAPSGPGVMPLIREGAELPEADDI